MRTEALQREGRLQMMGVIQEQHPDRCRLFMQWKQMDWPVAVDALNRLGFSGVPVTFLIDEHGVVRFVNPESPQLEEFLATMYPESGPLPALPEAAHLEALVPPPAGTAADWRDHGDALFLWGGPARVSEAIGAYARALESSNDHGPTHFRLGTAYRRRYDSPHRRVGDFQKAVDQWARALAIDPNQYIWRRRLQQYGPRLEKPYPFYHWVDEARRDIQARGGRPVPLVAEPGGAEVAAPEETFATGRGPGAEPDPGGRVTRDAGRLILVEATQVPPAVPPGGVARAYLVLRPNQAARAHWNNEVDPLQVWVEPPSGWEVDHPALTTGMPPEAVSSETREVQVEVKAPEDAHAGTTFLPAYALYYVCEDVNGMCLYRRQDLRIPIRVHRP